MSDVFFESPQGAIRRYVDLGDGTHAEAVTAVPSPLGLSSQPGDLDVWGTQKVSSEVSLFHGMFTFDVPPSKWLMHHAGSEVSSSSAITSQDGAGSIVADAAGVADAYVESRVCPRYQPNRGHRLATSVWCPNAAADGVREWGLQTDENGLFFRLTAAGLFAVVRKGGAETLHAITPPDGFDVTKGNVYDIKMQWRGAGNFFFYINLRKVLTISNLGTLSALSIDNPAMPARFRATANSGTVGMLVGCVDISSENGRTEQLEYNSASAQEVPVSGETPVIVIRQPLQIFGKTNTRDMTLARISVSCSKKAVFRMYVTRNGAAVTGATYAIVNAGSLTETDSPDTAPAAVRATAVTPSLARLVTAIPVEAAVPREVTNPWPNEIRYSIVRGDYIIITCEASAATADVVVEWGEHI